MKHHKLFFYIVSALLILASCSAEEDREIEDLSQSRMKIENKTYLPGELQFNLDDIPVATRTYIDESESTTDGAGLVHYAIHWEAGDRLLLSRDNTTEWYDFVVKIVPSGDGDGKSCAVAVNVNTIDVNSSFLSESSGNKFKGIYPADAVSFKNNNVLVNVPFDQKAVPGSFDPDANVSIGMQDGTDHIVFRNACPRIRFTITGDNASKVSSISFIAKPYPNIYYQAETIYPKLSGDFRLGNMDSATLELDSSNDGGSYSFVTLTKPDDGFRPDGNYYICVSPTAQYADGFTVAVNYEYEENGETVSRVEYHSGKLNMPTPSGSQGPSLSRDAVYSLTISTENLQPGGNTSDKMILYPATLEDPSVLIDGKINSAEKLQYLVKNDGPTVMGRQSVIKLFTLEGDVDVMEGYSPIISSLMVDFDGKNHTIEYKSGMSNPLFDNVASEGQGVNNQSGRILNLSVKGDMNGTGTSDGYLGGVANQVMSHLGISGCSFEGSISSESARYIGGIVGKNQADNGAKSIIGCSFVGTISASAANSSAGGIIGQNDGGSTLESCTVGDPSATTNTTVITATENAGGLVGFFRSGTIEKDDSQGISEVWHAQITAKNAGGVVGYSENGSIKDVKASECTITGSPSVSESLAGGLFGKTQEGSAYDCTVDGCVVSASKAGGACGEGKNLVFRNVSVLETTITGTTQDNSNLAGGYFGSSEECRQTGGGISGCTIQGANAGGVSGYDRQGVSSGLEILDCTVYGTAVDNTGTAGGIFGRSQGAHADTCTVTRTNINAEKYAGGFIGNAEGSSYVISCVLDNTTDGVFTHSIGTASTQFTGGVAGRTSEGEYTYDTTKSLFYGQTMKSIAGDGSLKNDDRFYTGTSVVLDSNVNSIEGDNKTIR